MSGDGLLELAQKALDGAKDGEAVEVYAEWSRNTGVRSYEGVPEQMTSAESRGVGVRVVTDGRLGYAYAADPEDSELAGLVAAARENASCAAPDPGNVLPEARPLEALDGLYFPEIDATTPDRKVELAVELERLTKAADTRIRTLRTAQYQEVVGRSAVASTTGIAAEAAAGVCYVVASAVAGDDEGMQSGLGFAFGRRPDDLDVEAAAQEAADRACRLLGARKPATARLPVLLDPFAAGDLFGVLASALDADAVLKGRSLFATKVGEQIAGTTLTLADDGRDARGLNAFPFDDEGVPRGRTPIVADGVLTGFLHNTSTATRMGAESTGNAARAGFRSPPQVAATTFAVEAGAESREELFRRAGRAIYVDDLIGVHSGANPISGDFSVGVTGLLVEDGELTTPVKEATIAGHLVEILKGIEAVGSDLRFLPGNVASPTILIGEMSVAGA